MNVVVLPADVKLSEVGEVSQIVNKVGDKRKWVSIFDSVVV